MLVERHALDEYVTSFDDSRAADDVNVDEVVIEELLLESQPPPNEGGRVRVDLPVELITAEAISLCDCIPLPVSETVVLLLDDRSSEEVASVTRVVDGRLVSVKATILESGDCDMAAVSDEDIDSEDDVRPLIDASCDEDPCEVGENKCDDSPDADNDRVAAPEALFVSIAETGELPELETVLISESDWRLEIEALLETVDREL